MKRLLTIWLLLIMLLMPVAGGQAAAYDIFSTCGSGSGNGTPDVCGNIQTQQKNNSTNPVIQTIKDAIDVISFIVGAVAVITIVVSGIRFMLSSGDSGAAASARTGLIYALVGIAVVVLSQTIVLFVLDKVK